ncbi:MAG: hypothetical protein AB1755_03030 [Candidatus Omnitrophota bacterium]
MKIIFKVIIIFVLIIFFLNITKNIFFSALVSGAIKNTTGLGVSFENFNSYPFLGKLDIENAFIFNPQDFPDEVMAYFPKISVDFNPGSIFKDKLHFREFTIYLKEFTVVRNKNGKLNIDSIKSVKARKANTRAASKKIKIDTLNLRIDKVIIKDYSKSPVLIREFDLNINEQEECVNDAYSLVNGIIAKAFYNTAVGQVLGVNFDFLNNDLSSLVKKSVTLPFEITTKGFDATKGFFNDISNKGKNIFTGIKNFFKKE